MPETFNPDKPFLSYEKRIDKLIDEYGLVITDRVFAKKALEKLSYYNLINGYQSCFKNPKTGQYKPDLTIEYLCRFHYFDKDFQHIFLEYCTYIEDMFKNHVSYVISKDFGVTIDSHLAEENYLNLYHSHTGRDHSLEKTLKNLRKLTDQKYMQNPTKYYELHHNHTPSWILFKNAKFTDVIDLYSLMKDEQKNQVCNLFFSDSIADIDLQKEFLKTSLDLVRRFRNRIAHNLQYFAFRPDNTKYSTKILQYISATSPLLSKSEVKKNKRGRNDVYAFMIAILYLLGSVDLIASFSQKILLLLAKDTMTAAELQEQPLFEIYRQITGLPLNLDERLQTILKICKN